MTAFLSLLAAAAPLAPADVHTVSASGVADFADLQAAVQAAQDGDILLVRTGVYGAFEIDGKSLSIVADDLAVVEIRPSAIRNLGPDQTVVLRGLSFPMGPADFFTRPLLRLQSNQGTVLVDSCHLDGSQADPVFTSGALQLEDSAEVVVAASTLVGAEGTQFFSGPGPFYPPNGITVVNSNLAVFDCEITGGDGATGFFSDFDVFLASHAGANAIWASVGEVFVSGSDLTGGRGGDGAHWPGGACFSGQDGGAAIALADAQGVLLDCTLTPGAGGVPTSLPCTSGAVAPPSELSGSATLDLPVGSAASLAAASPVREGASLTVDLSATPGSTVIGAFTPALGYLDAPFALGVSALSGTPFLFHSGAMPGIGTLPLSFPVPDLGPGVEGVELLLQAVEVPATGALVLTGPASVLLLDGAL